MDRVIYSGNELIAFDGSAQVIGTYQSPTIDLSKFKPRGYFSAQVDLDSAGASVLQLQYLLSNDGDPSGFYLPVGAVDIVTAHAVGSAFYKFYPKLGVYMQIQAIISAVNATEVKVQIAIQ